jgi:hypothetical protein
MTYYKVLAADGISPQHGGSGKWFIPKGKRMGKWMPAIKDIQPCERGYHFVNIEQLPQWLGPTLYEIEVRGQVIYQADKSVAEQARLIRKVETWNDKTLRLYAADCAERVLGLYEKQYPKDDRPRKAIQAARDFANGLITKDAARDAAYAANAARDAAHAANAASAAHAAYAAARDAAHAANAAYAAHAAHAAAAAARDAAYAANAASAAAARDAAYAANAASAAHAAYAAARDAAYAANAASAAAHAADEKTWQIERLKYYLEVA